MEIALSILNITDIEKLKELNELPFSYLHLDIMDGKFVTNKTLEKEELLKYVKVFNKKIDIHLMVEDVDIYLKEYALLNPSYITFHIETDVNIKDMIEKIHSYGIKAGISIKPNTNIDAVEPYLKDIDLILIMSVEPGMGGQTFKEESILKINKLVELRKINNYSFKIEVDGGINNETIKQLNNVDMAVVGSYLTKDDNITYNERYLKLMGEQYDCKN